MSINNIILASLIGYTFGCFQTSFFLGKLTRKIDIRQHGTNNAGASNVVHVLGWKYGIITALCDVGKALLAVLVVGWLYPNQTDLLYVAGVSAVLGHIFPVILKFRGGKGAASMIGMTLAIDWRIGLLFIFMMIFLTVILDYIAISTFCVALALPINSYFTKQSLFSTLLCFMLFFVITYKHLINLQRIISGEEVGLRATLKGKRARTLNN